MKKYCCFLSTTLLPCGDDMLCRSFSISTRWPNVINIQGWFLPDHGYFITDDKPCSGKVGGSVREEGGVGWMLRGWAQPLQRAETDCHAFASTSNPPFSRSVWILLQLSGKLASGGNVKKKKKKKSGSSWASFQLRGHAQELKKKRVLPLDKTSRGQKCGKTEGLFLDQPLQLWIFYSLARSFDCTEIHI